MELYNKKNLCCGCTACVNICPNKAIKMIEDEEGFLYPEIDKSKCIECGLCKKVCAFQNGYDIDNRLKDINVYATKSKSDEVRYKSSSGGMFTEISDYVLKNNGVIYGVAFDSNFKAIHIRAENEKERDRCKGSKYSQSELNDIYLKVKSDLEENRLVMFTGTPCQVAGLNKFLLGTNKEKLILIDIICHGTPSPKLFQDYIKCIEKINKSEVKEYYHKAKDLGWGHIEKVVYKNGKVDKTSLLSQAWKMIFYTNLGLRPSCYNCKYTNTKRSSDITIADFWGIEKSSPEFADKKGISLVIVNTNKGQEVFDNIKNNIDYKEENIDNAIIKNPQLKQSVKIDFEKRKEFWNAYNRKGMKYIIKKYGRYNLKSYVKDSLKKLLKKK